MRGPMLMRRKRRSFSQEAPTAPKRRDRVSVGGYLEKGVATKDAARAPNWARITSSSPYLETVYSKPGNRSRSKDLARPGGTPSDSHLLKRMQDGGRS